MFHQSFYQKLRFIVVTFIIPIYALRANKDGHHHHHHFLLLRQMVDHKHASQIKGPFFMGRNQDSDMWYFFYPFEFVHLQRFELDRRDAILKDLTTASKF